jgi:inner membrane protein
VPSVFTHAAVALSIGSCFYPRIPPRAVAVGALCAVVPDLDVIGFSFGVHYGDFLGHRGFTHSLLFAALLASVAIFLSGGKSKAWALVWIYLFIATASHGFLDAFTNGGLGVAFLSPFEEHRYFFPWRPVRVAPIGLTRFFSPRGLVVFESELLWIWLPAALLASGAWIWRRGSRH